MIDDETRPDQAPAERTVPGRLAERTAPGPLAERTAPGRLAERTAPGPFGRLPPPVRLEDTVATHETRPAPDPTAGRDPDRDVMLRNAAP